MSNPFKKIYTPKNPPILLKTKVLKSVSIIKKSMEEATIFIEENPNSIKELIDYINKTSTKN